MNKTLCKNVHWVGYVDWTVRDFHSYNTVRGATYNSYLICDEKNTLIDAVKAPYAKDLLANIQEHTNTIDYIIVNHAEPDHSGSLPVVVAAYPSATIVCNKKCQDILSRYYDISGWNFHFVKTGDVLSLGERTVTFLDTPMVHWPDSMFTYLTEEKILFSMDAFGQHYASGHRFDDEVDITEVMEEAKKYYANIVMPYGKPTAKVLQQAAGMDIAMIAPSHGIIWRRDIADIVAAYQDWAVCKPKAKVLVIYDSMWESTKLMAEAIVAGANKPKVEAKMIYVRGTGLTEIATEIIDAAAVAFGSATLNMGMMPMMGAVMTYLKGLRPQQKVGFAFGSYGWGKGAPEAIEDFLTEMKIEIVREPLKSQWRPDKAILEECYKAGEILAEKALNVGGIS